MDGTARLQTTINSSSDFGKATDVPVLLNTSFNLKGEPIVNTSDPTSGR